MPDAFVPPITGAPQRTRAFFTRVADQARRASLKQFDAGRPPNRTVQIRPCRVQKNGGNNGSDSVDCSITYDLYELDNTTKINTTGGAVTPKGPPRDAKVEYTPATYGEYFIDANNTLALKTWNEAPATEDCAA